VFGERRHSFLRSEPIPLVVSCSNHVCEVIVETSAYEDGCSVILEEALSLHRKRRGLSRNKREILVQLPEWSTEVQMYHYWSDSGRGSYPVFVSQVTPYVPDLVRF
jgi:hypothetical protein